MARLVTDELSPGDSSTVQRAADTVTVAPATER